MRLFNLIAGYIHYRLTSKNKHGIHSPFVFALLTNVISDKNNYYAYEKIEPLRKKLLHNKQVISMTDLGAGSSINQSQERSVRSIAKHSLKSKKYGQLLFRLVNYFEPSNVLELGTSLGISTLYMAAPAKKSLIYTIEGCPQTAKIAKQNFSQLNAGNIYLSVGSFEENLPPILEKITTLDFVFIDGNHRKEPLLNYFELCLKRVHDKTVLVIDDINWSDEMKSAWETIKNHPQVTLTIDLFFMGLVFFKPGRAKEHFRVFY